MLLYGTVLKILSLIHQKKDDYARQLYSRCH